MSEELKYVLYIVSGVIALIFSLITFIIKKRNRVLVSKSITDGFWVINFLFHGNIGYSGAIQNALAVIRDLFSIGNEKKIIFFTHKFWIIIFTCSYVIVPIFTWKEVGWISLIPMLGSMISTIALFSSSTKIMKILTIPAQGLCLVYSAIIINIFGILAYSFQIIGAIIGLIRLYKDTYKGNE